MRGHPRRNALSAFGEQPPLVDLDAEPAAGVARARLPDNPGDGDRATQAAAGAVLLRYTPAEVTRLLAVRGVVASASGHSECGPVHAPGQAPAVFPCRRGRHRPRRRAPAQPG
jgi:hypothetical protein